MNAKLVKFLRFLAPCSAITGIAGYVVHAQLSHLRPNVPGSKSAAFDQLLTRANTVIGSNSSAARSGLLQYEIGAPESAVQNFVPYATKFCTRNELQYKVPQAWPGRAQTPSQKEF